MQKREMFYRSEIYIDTDIGKLKIESIRVKTVF